MPERIPFPENVLGDFYVEDEGDQCDHLPADLRRRNAQVRAELKRRHSNDAE